jgi:hypothetical protein
MVLSKFIREKFAAAIAAINMGRDKADPPPPPSLYEPYISLLLLL